MPQNRSSPASTDKHNEKEQLDLLTLPPAAFQANEVSRKRIKRVQVFEVHTDLKAFGRRLQLDCGVVVGLELQEEAC
ncbi:MAG TPA: hypothetical protein VHU19_08660 [Pyrinomonadaceae bacterium]|nr:hypothetical protein [Pyrinomonadaceae bacterium]